MSTNQKDPAIEAARLYMLGAISELPKELQEKVHTAADKIRAAVTEAGDEGQVALSLVAIEHAGT